MTSSSSTSEQRFTTGHAVPGAILRLRVLVADHDTHARQTMLAALRDADRTTMVVTAGDGPEALELARSHRPAVAIIDTGLPPDGGIAALTAMLSLVPETNFLSMSASVLDSGRSLDALRAGAIGHIAKDGTPDELARQVARAANGEAIVPSELLLPLLELVRALPHRGWRPLHSRLTTREWEIIELIEQGATTHRIAQQLALAPTTVYSHIKNVLRKLDVHTRHEAVIAARQLRAQETKITPTRGETPLPAER